MPRIELYVGNLNRDVSRRDLEDAFERYGRVVKCDLKNRGIQKKLYKIDKSFKIK